MQYLIKNEFPVTALSKLYVWSILFEPLTYFVIVTQNVSGVGGNISRVFQLIVIISLSLKALVTLKIRFSNPFSLINRFYSYYFIFIIVIGIIGYITGSYSYYQGSGSNGLNFFSTFINSSFFRPFFEYLIVIYYFVYFVILAQYFLVNKGGIDYFFKWFNVLFLICIFVGFIDLLLIISFNPEYDGIGRHIADKSYPGNRFHGIAGEPRDAFSYLILCIGIFTLRDIWYKKKRLTYFWLMVIFIAMFASQAFSGVLGLIFSIPLFAMFFLPNISLKNQIIFLFLASLSLILVYINIKYSIRMSLYYDSFFSLYQSLSSGEQIDTVLINVINNIYPLWHLWLEVEELNFYHLFFGNGVGSSSIINNFYFKEAGVINPNSSLVRMIYEVGIIGILLFVLAFISPLRYLSDDHKIYYKLKLLMLLILGVYFSHRSVSPFFFLGITLVIFRYKLDDKINNNSKNEV